MRYRRLELLAILLPIGTAACRVTRTETAGEPTSSRCSFDVESAGNIAVASPRAEDFVGSWTLVSIDHLPPSALGVDSFVATYSSSGTWTFISKESGKERRGDGTWTVSPDSLIDFGATKSRASVRESSFFLEADPALTSRDGSTPARTSYTRVHGSTLGGERYSHLPAAFYDPMAGSQSPRP